MEQARYTPFPDLNALLPQTQLPETPSEQSWAIAALHLPLGTILLSWANLLCAYTGDATPVFALDGQAIKFDIAQKEYSRVEVQDPTPENGSITGVWSAPGHTQFSLELRCNLQSGSGVLVSRLTVAREFVGQIAQQLLLYAQQLSHRNEAIESAASLRPPQLSILNPRPRFLDGPKLLHELVSLNGVGTNCAIDFLDSKGGRVALSYQELDETSSNLARRIETVLRRRRGTLNEKNIIPLLIPQSPALYITIIAVLKAGAAFCPLNLDAPEERVRYILRDVSADVVITTEGFRAKFMDYEDSMDIITIDRETVAEKRSRAGNPARRATKPEDLAYVMYTSGSTGLPKGVGVSHRAATQALLAHHRHLPSFKRFLQFAAPTFDVSVFEIFFPLYRASTLICCDRAEMLTDLPSIMNKLEVDAAELTPTVAATLLRKRSAVPSLKVLLTIGEMLTRYVVNEFGHSSEREGILYAMYGPTEAAIHCTIAPRLESESKVGLIGVPLDPVSSFILAIDESGGDDKVQPEILPIGQIGELAVGGYQIADGYLNQGEKTRRAFIDHPQFGRLYRTGDKARVLPSGDLECLGRIAADQVKLRGQRVELGEIEQTVCRTPGVHSASADIIEGILVVFCMADLDTVEKDHVLGICKRWLPTFMIPGDIVLIKDVPRLPSGKIDKMQLRGNYQEARYSAQVDNRAYEDELEESIAECASELLGRRIGSTSSLSAAGLDSLTVIQLASGLREISVHIPVPLILEADSIRAIHDLHLMNGDAGYSASTPTKEVSLVWKAVKASGMKALPRHVKTAEVEDIIPCTPVQQAMLVESASNSQSYFNWIELNIGVGTTVEDFKSAFRTVAAHNEILRSGFIASDVSSHTHAQVVWVGLDDHRFHVVQKLVYEPSLVEDIDLLRPLHFQFLLDPTGTRVLVHIHHSLYDGWSWDLIIDDLNRAFVAKDLPPRPLYRVLTAFHSNLTTSNTLDETVEYWRDHLYNLDPVPFPNFNDTTKFPAGTGTITQVLNVELSKLSTVSRNMRISRPAFFQAALTFLISSYSGSSDVCFASVSSGRVLPIENIEDIIGPCITTLPLRIDISSCRTISDLLVNVQILNRKMLHHGMLPLQAVKKAARLEHGRPLFDVLFVWQETSHRNSPSPQPITQVASADFSEFSLVVELEPRDGQVNAKATFLNSVLPEDQVTILLEQLSDLTTTFIKSSGLPLNDVGAQLATSRLSIENLDFQRSSCSPDLAGSVERIAKEDGERVAIEFLKSFDADSAENEREQISYKELNRKANLLANYLLAKQVKANQLVCIIMEKSIQLYISILAVIKAGAAYLPLTPQTPSKRIQSIIDEAGVRLCLTDSSLSDIVILFQPGTRVEIDKCDFRGWPDTLQRARVQSSDLAYAVFTSGSTGKPKGVLVTHGNLMSNIHVLSEIYPSFKKARLLQSCSPAFDVSVFEIFYTWHNGFTLCSATNDILFRDIEASIRAMHITHLSLTPTVAALVDPANVPSVQFLVTAGEAVTLKVFHNWAGRGLHQGYGPSETTNICTVKPAVLPRGVINDIGPPLNNTSAFVARETTDFSLVLRGAVGELCFGGEQVGRGYLNLREMTEDKFIQHPEFGRLYRSGDFGRLLPNGNILFLGRKDDQVKIRGQRIELEEINRCLLRSSYVADCTTFIADRATGHPQELISFWISPSPIDPTNSILKTRCAELFDMLNQNLPMYMVPSVLLPVSSIPMTAQGKIDKKTLLNDLINRGQEVIARYSRGSDGAEDDGSDLSSEEQEVATLLASITSTPKSEIRSRTSFFSLGLDSFSAILFSRQLKERFGQVDVSTILRNSSISRLLPVISKPSRKWLVNVTSKLEFQNIFDKDFIKDTKSAFQSQGKSVQNILPCTALQEAMLARREHGSPSAYMNRLLFRIYVDPTSLREAWQEMINRHDLLRTCFVSTDNTRYPFAQVVLKNFVLPWSVVRVPPGSLSNQLEGFKEVVFEDMTPPLFLRMVENADDSTRLLFLSMHHAMYDAEGMRRLLQEIEQLVQGRPLPAPPVFADFLAEVFMLDTKETDEFWGKQLAAFTPFPWPTSGVNAKYKAKQQSAQILLECSLSWVENECRHRSITLLAVLQATWAKLIHEYFGITDICFGNIFSGRTVSTPGVDRIVGPCFNTLPIRTKVSQDMVNLELMKALQATNIDVLPFQLSSLRRIQAKHSQGGQRLFDTMILLQKGPYQLDRSIWSLEEDSGTMDFPIILEVQPDRRKDALDLTIYFDPAYLSKDDSKIVMHNFDSTFQQCLRYPLARVTDDSILKGRLPSIRGRTNAVHRSRGPPPSQESKNSTQQFTVREKDIQEVLETLSGVGSRHINLDTTIFELGLDSINAIQIAGQLRKLGIDVSATDVFEAPSIRQLLSLAESRATEEVVSSETFDFSSFDRQHRPKACQLLSISPNVVEAVRPCTSAQAGMLAEFLQSDGCLYLNHMVLRIDSSINTNQLHEAWELVRRMHQMLRTGFVLAENRNVPFLMITYLADHASLPWAEIKSTKDVAVDGTFGSLSEFRHRMQREILNSLHLPPWRLTLWEGNDSSFLQFSGLHTLYDAQSLNLILQDVACVLQGGLPESPPDILPTLGSILDAESDKAKTNMFFWQSLRDKFSITKFPDLNISRVYSEESLCLTKTCSLPRTELQGLCRKLGVTLQAAGQVAWARLLSKYCGESEVTFGLVLSGRRISEEAQQTVFPCLTTIPYPCAVRGINKTLLQHVMKLNSSLSKHQFTPLTQIERWINAEEKLFDSVFVYQKLPGNEDEGMPWQISQEEANTNFAASIELMPGQDDTLEFRVTFQRKKVPNEQAILILEQLDALLNDTLLSPDKDCSNMSSMDRSILSMLPPKDRIIPSDIKVLHEFVESYAVTSPDKVALEFATRVQGPRLKLDRWTYKELNDLGNQYARLLTSHGIKSGDLVCICFDKCPASYFAILGVLKIGSAYVALDPGAPIGRKSFIVEDSGSKAVLCTSQQMEDLHSITAIPVIDVERPGLLKDVSNKTIQTSRSVEPSDTCYCLYTSGTTGTPKGCEITHENAVQAMLSFQRLFRDHWDADSRWLQFASFHFDVSVLEQYWSWSVGICVTSAPRDVIFEDIAEIISELQITHIDLTPSLAKLLHPDDVPSLCKGVFITGGEQLKKEILDAWGDTAVIYNGYGPTEVTIGCTMYPRVPKDAKPSNIGPQFDNVGSYVMEPNTNNPVLRGAVGELCVSGKLVGRGYLNRPDLTAEKFQIVEPDSERIYRTGDLVRLLYNGSFEFLGRIDDQVKLRGQRLEVAEVDQVIKTGANSEIEATTLVLKHPKQAKEQLVSFVAKSSSRKASRAPQIEIEGFDEHLFSKIKEACLQSLPGYMVPTYVLSVSSIPLNPNNKVDGKRLKALFAALSPEDLQRFSAPSPEVPTANTADIKRIIAVLANELEVLATSLNAHSNIFELGLDSISVIGFTRALVKAGFINAKISLVMRYPIVGNLAAALSGLSRSDEGLESARRAAKQKSAAFSHRHLSSIQSNLNISVKDIESIAPCTPLQDGMIYKVLSSGKPVYYSSFTFLLTASIDLERLRQAWSVTQSATQVLRTRLVSTPDGYSQVVIRNTDLPWEHTQVRHDEGVNALSKSHHRRWWQRNRDLTLLPWQIVIAESQSQRFMILHIFHALYDGNSLPLLLDLVITSYREREVPIQQPTFHQILPLGPLCEPAGAHNFWIKHLSGANVAQLPLTVDSKEPPSIARLQEKNVPNFQKVRRRLNVTDQSILHAAWIVTIANWFHFVPTLGLVVSGRSIDVEGAQRVIGPMFNTIPSYIQLSRTETWSGLVQKCHEYNISSLPYQQTPLRNIMKWCKRRQDQPLFDILFVFQRNGNPDQRPNTLWKMLESTSDPDYPLAFEAEIADDGALALTIVAWGDLMTVEEAETMIQLVEENLHSILRDPQATILIQELKLPDPSNGQLNSAPDERALQTNDVDEPSEFNWAGNATQIRTQITALANVDESTVNSNISIFELGLDSIDAIKLSSRLSKEGIKLSVSAIMRARTIQRMCAEVENNLELSMRYSSIALVNEWESKLRQSMIENGHRLENVERVLPPTPLQEAMVAEMLTSSYRHYFNHDVLELEPSVDVAKLILAWNAVFHANPVLRTSFAQVDDPNIPFAFVQLVMEKGNLPFERIQVSNDAEFSKEIGLAKAKKPSGIHDSLIRLTLVVSPSRTLLVLSIAHALYDGWSLGLLHQDVRDHYYGNYCPRPSYQDVLGDTLDSSNEDAANFWQGALSDTVSTLFPRKLNNEQNALLHRKERTSRLTSKNAKRMCRDRGITLQALGVTCWSLVLAHRVRNLDVVFGMVLSGRDTEESSGVMFPTMNTVPVRSVIHGSASEMMSYIQDVTMNVSKYQHYPLRKAKASTGSGAHELFNTLFIFQRRPEQGDVGSEPLYHSTDTSSDVEYPICVELEVVDQHLTWRVACKDLFLDDSGTDALLDELDHVLQSILEQPEKPLIKFVDKAASICGLPPFNTEPTQPERYHVTNGASNSSTAEWTAMENEVRAVLSTVSGIDEADIRKNMTLFHLGLDSISAIKVSSLLRRQFILISVSEMLRAATIENIAKVAEEPKNRPHNGIQKEVATWKSLNDVDKEKVLQDLSLSPSEVESILPTTAGQIFMLSAWQNSEGAIFYPSFSYHVLGHIKQGVIANAWNRLVSRLPILRTLFYAETGMDAPFLQVVKVKNSNPIIWLSDDNDDVKSRQNKSPFSHPPVTLYGRSSSESTISLTLHIHHALYDGVSLPRMIQDLEDLCNGVEDNSGGPHSLDSFINFDSGTSIKQRQEYFWKSYLVKQPAHLANISSAPLGERYGTYRPGLLKKIGGVEDSAKRHGISIQSLFLAAYARVHCSLLDENSSKDLVIGVYLANRSHSLEGLPDLIAPTMNLLPLVIKNAQQVDLLANAKNIQRDLQEVGQAQISGTSLADIEKWTGVMVDCFVNFLKLPDPVNRNAMVGSADKRIRIYEMKGEKDVESTPFISTNQNERKLPNPVGHAYVPSIDIEAAIRDDGLDVGVFGPKRLLDGERAATIISGLKEILSSLADSDSV